LKEPEKNRYREFRAGNPVGRSQSGHYAISFSACQDREVALENAGQGDFTRRAVPLLRSGFRQVSHSGFQQQVTDAFGADPRQTPRLDCDPALRGATLLASGSNGAAQPLLNTSGNSRNVVDVVQANLRKMIDDLDRLR